MANKNVTITAKELEDLEEKVEACDFSFYALYIIISDFLEAHRNPR